MLPRAAAVRDYGRPVLSEKSVGPLISDGQLKIRALSDTIGALSEYDFYPLPPALVNAHKFPFNFRGDIPQQSIRCRVHMERRRYQKKQRRLVR